MKSFRRSQCMANKQEQRHGEYAEAPAKAQKSRHGECKGSNAWRLRRIHSMKSVQDPLHGECAGSRSRHHSSRSSTATASIVRDTTTDEFDPAFSPCCYRSDGSPLDANVGIRRYDWKTKRLGEDFNSIIGKNSGG